MHKNTLLLKFLLVLAPVFLVIVLVGSFVAAKTLIRDNTGELTTRIGGLSARVAIALDLNEAHQYKQLASDLIAPLGVDRATVCVEYRAVGESGFIAAHPPQLGCKGQQAPFSVDIPVDYDNQYNLTVRFSDREITNAVKKQIGISATVLALAFLVTLLSATIGFRLIVSRRLLVLHDAIKKAANEFERKKIKTAGHDELADIIRAYNALMDREATRERQLQSANEILTRQSRQDPLTGLCNRRHFSWLMESEAHSPSRNGDGQCSALILLDLDHFKQINDSHGHAAGDEVLVETARRLSEALPERATLVRWGGEEFLIYLPQLDFTEVESFGALVLAVIGKEPFDTGCGAIAVSASVGIVRLPFLSGNHQISAEQAVGLADAALYRAKKTGRNRAISIIDQSVLSNDVKTAIEENFSAAEERGLIHTVAIPGPVITSTARTYLKRAS